MSGTHGIGVLMANSLMFQRFPDHDGYDDPQFSSFYGQTLPLLKRGIPVELVHMENTPFGDTFKGLKVLVMSYSNMKPMEPRYHDFSGRTGVRKGGALIYCGEDIDPYQRCLNGGIPTEINIRLLRNICSRNWDWTEYLLPELTLVEKVW